MRFAYAAAVVVTVVGLVGYGVGVATPYPGRAFSLTLLMAGITLATIARSEVERDP